MYRPQTAVAVGVLVSALGAAAIGAGPAGAGGSPVIHPPVPLATPVSACGTLAAPGGRYVLAADLKQSSGPCLVITAPRVTLDLAGHTLTGPWQDLTGPVIVAPGWATTTGILVASSAANATVQSTVPGGAVAGFENGIEDLADDAVIAGPDLLVEDNVEAGVWVRDATGSVVKGTSFNANIAAGIRLLSSTAAVQRDIIVGSRLYGIWALGGHGSTISGNVISVSGKAGVLLGCLPLPHLHAVGCATPPRSFKITHNYMLDNGNYGIVVEHGSLENVIDANTVAGDSLRDLQDGNPGCAGVSKILSNSWSGNTGTRNQKGSATCIG